MNEQINQQIALLQEELSRLKKATDYIDNAETNSTLIINELELIQQNYTRYTNDLYALYEQSVSGLKKEVEANIENEVLRIREVGHQIDHTNRELLVETKNLIEQYEDVVEAGDSLIETLNAIDFHQKLDGIVTKTEQLIESETLSNQTIEQKINETQKLIAEKSQELKDEIEKLILSEFNRCKEIIYEHREEYAERQAKQEQEIRTVKVFSLIICGLVILSMIIMMIK